MGKFIRSGKNNEKLKKALKEKDREQYRQAACEEWIDVRAFGQVFGFNDQKGMSEGIRGRFPFNRHLVFALS